MSILVDYSAIAIASVMVQLKGSNNFDEGLIRHIVLNNLRAARSKYHKQCGEVIICCDGPRSWRKDIYPYYKAGRKTSREAGTFEWHRLFAIVDKIKNELETSFPYKVVKVDGLEADDIIATLCIETPGPHLIVSNDKDFNQLQKIDGVKMYSPLNSGLVTCKSPETFLKEHIIKGDASDGIPNILSDDDTFVNPDKRQKPLRRDKLRALVEHNIEDVLDAKYQANYKRNEALISLFLIPEEIKLKAVSATEVAEAGSRTNLPAYFMEHRLRNMLERISDF